MGRLKKGVFGAFSGKVGNVIGSSWRDIDYIRSLPVKVRDPKTKRQIRQRSRFSVTMDFLKTITPFLRIGFQSHANGRMTAFNAAMSYNMKFGVKGAQQDLLLDYPNVVVSHGELSAASDVDAEIVEGELRVKWGVDLQGNARADNIAMVVAHNPVNRQSVYDVSMGKRISGKADLLLPPGWKGDVVETYLSFRSSDGVLVSDSVYAGRHFYV